MRTKREKISGTASVWALPRTAWEIEQSDDGRPFRYLVKTDTAWQDGAVRVCDFKVDTWIPDDIDLVERAIETMQEKINSIQKNAQSQVDELMKQIKSMQLIEHLP